MAVLLVHLDNFCISTPLQPLKPGAPINAFIRHYEPVKYDALHLKRHRRSATNRNAVPLKFNIKTQHRTFNLVLTPDHGLFAEDAVFEASNGRRVTFDPGKAYTGVVEDEEDTLVHGIITDEGLFDGTILTPSEEYYIEPLSRYLSGGDQSPPPPRPATRTVTTRSSTAARTWRSPAPRSAPPRCSTSGRSPASPPTTTTTGTRPGTTELPAPASVNSNKFSDNRLSSLNFSHQLNEERPRARTAPEQPKTESSILSGPRDRESSSGPKDRNQADFLDRTGNSILADLFLGHKHEVLSRPKRWFVVMNETSHPNASSTRGQPTSTTTPRPRNIISNIYNSDIYSVRNNIIRLKAPPTMANITRPRHVLLNEFHTERDGLLVGAGSAGPGFESNSLDDDDLRAHVRKRATIDPRKTTCMLYLQADHLFFEKYGTEEACIEVMTRHVQRVNSIYKHTDFNQDGQSDNISFMIKRIKVHSGDAMNDPAYRFPGNYGVEKFLEIFSEEDYDAFCLAYMFTYRDFEMGTLGLAWTGDLKNAGGVCEKNGHYRGSMKSLNTGIVTLLNYGKHVPPAVSHVTLAHEIGHNFGSPHDPEICTPGGDDGNFIMFARATSGDKRNNNRFSPCSLNSINPVLNTKARSSKGCFTEPQASICGNGVVEGDEECDCGWEEDCSDKCCYPQRRYPPIDEPPCHLTPRSQCSPSQGPCCTTDCALKFGDKCRDDNGCRDSSFCDGKGPSCPPSINKPNKTICNEEYVCFMGECTGSICLAYGLESCQCIPGPNDPPTKACELCCKAPGENQPCLSSYKWNSAPYDVPDMLSKPGTPCNDYNGYCDVFQRCREVDPSGPLATLRKLLLSEESIASFKRWTIDHWYYSSLIVFSFVLILVLSTRLFGKRPDLKLKAVTIIHSSTTETVRLPPPDASGPGVTVHPAIKSKLPLKRKVRGDGRKIVASKVKKENSSGSNVNNNNSPIGKGKKADTPATKESENSKPMDSTPESSPTRKVQKKSKNISKDKKKYVKVRKLDGDGKTGKSISSKPPEDDPFGKVRNWLLNSHIDGLASVRKSKSSPAGFSPNSGPQDSANASANQLNSKVVQKVEPRNASSTENKSNDQKVKLQVVYKPAFKFYVKLKKPPCETQTKVVKTKPKQPVNPAKQRALILLKAEKNSEQKIRQEKKKQKKLAELEKKLVSEKKENVALQKKSRHKDRDSPDGPCDASAGDASPPVFSNDIENIPMGKHSDQVKLIDKKEPLYANTSAAPSNPVYENVKTKPVDLLRMTSTECKKPLQEPILSQHQLTGSSMPEPGELSQRSSSKKSPETQMIGSNHLPKVKSFTR
ncbi:LOW QUALITY PROTEIN: uncharacterized protein Kul [Bemisia tabaci]|uniref:LOW QUALITY PROTEIN: uncharacterized protein Kul n=1 Tax=Bemisia tabaci TaxID=7038 RepID=UPI003B28C764